MIDRGPIRVQCPCGAILPAAEAPAHCEAEGIMPEEAIRAMLANEDDPRHGGTHLTWSVMNPDTTCRREVLFNRFYPTLIQPRGRWEAMEGILFHEVFAAHTSPEWFSEYSLPGTQHRDHPHVRECADGVLELEVFPGIWWSTRADRVKRDFTAIHDFKTARVAKTDYGPKKAVVGGDWALQLNLERIAVRMLEGVEPTNLAVWRMYKGSYEPTKTWRFFPVSLMSDESLERHVRKHCESLTDLLAQASGCGDLAALDLLIKSVPKDGEHQFGGKRCSQYCGQLERCRALSGTVFF